VPKTWHFALQTKYQVGFYREFFGVGGERTSATLSCLPLNPVMQQMAVSAGIQRLSLRSRLSWGRIAAIARRKVHELDHHADADGVKESADSWATL